MKESRPGTRLVMVLALSLAAPIGPAALPAAAQDAPACVPESEPNDQLTDPLPSLSGDLCLTGTLPFDREQDLVFWEVLPEDGLTRWTVTVRGVPTAVTSVRVFPILSTAGATPTREGIASSIHRVDSDAHPDTPPGVASLQLPPGRYLLGISRGWPSFGQKLTDDVSYEISVVADRNLPPSGDAEPNDDPTTATTVAGAFELSGDLAGSEDHYRWTVSDEDAATPWRLEARSALDTPISMELLTADGTPVATAVAPAAPENEPPAAEDGVATLHDLGLAPGEFRIRLRPWSSVALPYILAATPLTEPNVDAEPNDTPEQAIDIDPVTATAHGRLTSALDVDQFVLDVDDAFGGHLVDIDLSSTTEALRRLCVSTEEQTQIGCFDGEGRIALPGMLLAQARYLLTVSGAGDLEDRYELRVAPGDALPPAASTVPGPDVATASPVSGSFAVSGDLTGSTSGTGHVYAWTLSEADAERTWRLDLSATPGIAGRLDLYDATAATLLASASIGQEGTAWLWDLRLPAGTYALWLTPSGAAAPAYVLRSSEELAADVDPEPDDTIDRAVPLDPATLTARGRIATRADVDRYSFELDDTMAASSLEVSLTWPGPNRYMLCLETEFGSQIQCRESRDGIVLSDLVLAPGRYGIQVAGNGDPEARYDLAVRSGPPPSAEREAEPNDAADAATAWDPAVAMHATSLDGDVDVYGVSVPPGEPQIWRLEATGSGLDLPTWTQPDGTAVGKASIADDGTLASIDDLFLVQGDHLLTMRANGGYTLALTPLGPPDLAAEREPNDDSDRAGRLRMGEARTGRLPAADDVDVYRFSLAAPEHVIVDVEPPGDGAVALEIASAGAILATVPSPGYGQPTVFDGHLPHADIEVWLRAAPPAPGGVSEAAGSEGTYAIRLERADPFTPGAGEPARRALDATPALTIATTEVAAFAADGQRVDGTLSVTNDGATETALTIDATVSDERWTVELPSPDGIAPAGGTTEIPLVIHVPGDAWLDIPVRITVRARDAAGAQATAFAEITPVRDIAPVAPEPYWAVPAELLGGLNVASTALGSVSTTPRAHDWDLYDGVSIAGLGVGGSVQNGPDTIGVDLAGDEPVPVVGTILDPLGGGGEFAYRPRAFTLLLSEDGSTYREVLSAELGPQTVEQAFLLPEPVMARHAQLRIDSTWGATPTTMTLGEWKVIAAPGFAPDPATAGLDIAARGRGGHVVYNDPAWQAASHELLDEADTNLSDQALDPTETQTWVIGFFGDRAAQITHIEWVDQVGSVPENRFTTADVAISVDSPLGPWESLGTWALDRAADGSVGPFVLPEPTWARFVKLTALGSAEVSGLWELPGAIRVIERTTDDTYRSILAEWGQSSPRGIYELLVPPPAFDPAFDAADVGGTAEEAAPIEAGAATPGHVSRVTSDVDWYALTVPAGDNTLTIDMRTERARDVRPRLLDASGGEVDLQERGRRGEPPVESWTAIVEPGEYRLELVQPVLSVVVAFDTSASIYPWFPKLRAAVRSFADDVTPGQEAIQIFGFQETELLQDWSDQPYLIGGAIDAWVSEGGSSAIRASVVDAAAMLQERDGMRAILVFGDAVGGGFDTDGLPVAELDLVQPAIFPVHLGGTDDPAVSTRIMQDLAAAGDGFYQYATSQAALERAFDRMATWLRRPAPYSLSYETSAVEYPPGTIAIVPAEGTAVPIGGGVGVELILDTSGSMLKPLGGTTRMAVARDVLSRLVDASLPEGLPVALRTFKAATKKSRCDTVLAVPLGPLDRAEMRGVINKLKINRRTSTPIGAALAEVAGDIGDATGPKVVVLVTDGEETCKGDPGAEVQRLVDAGFEATINIVGFALDDPELKLEMESWSTLGGGRFYDAQDQESLLAGISAALQAPFRVFDDDGVLVASGIVDGPGVELPVGTYRVEVLTEPPVTFEDVDLPPGLAVRLTVGESQEG